MVYAVVAIVEVVVSKFEGVKEVTSQLANTIVNVK